MKAALATVMAAVRARGVAVRFEAAPSDELRYVGIFREGAIVLYSAEDPLLALFTVAHLFGHLCQQATGDAARARVAGYVGAGRTLSEVELQEITAYEFEAACIGRALLGEVLSPLPSSLDAAYARIFFADAAYLSHFLRTGERGPHLFARFLAAQRGEALVPADARLLRHSLHGAPSDIVVV